MDFQHVDCDNKSDKKSTPKAGLDKLKKQIARTVIESPFRNLPNYSTPPSKFTKIVNPFERHLFERLHLPTFSPDVFRQISTPNSELKFKWTIDDISMLRPADIDESTMSQYVVTEDPSYTESMMQQKITTFFNENQVVPSPLNNKVDAICMVRGSLEGTPEKSVKNTRDNAAQTVLTLPPFLSKELEDALKPYFNHAENQQQCTDASMNEASLYKELFEFGDNIQDSPEVQSSCSPPAAMSGNSGIPAMLFSPNTRGFGSPPELKNCTISPITKTLPTTYTDDVSMIVPSDKANQQMSSTCTPVKKNDTIFGKNTNCSMESKQVSISSSSSTDSNKMDVSNSNTPNSKLFIGKGQRKRLSESFRSKLEGGQETASLQHEVYEKNSTMPKTDDTTDVGYCTHDTGEYSNNFTNVFASTPSKRNVILDLQ